MRNGNRANLALLKYFSKFFPLSFRKEVYFRRHFITLDIEKEWIYGRSMNKFKITIFVLVLLSSTAAAKGELCLKDLKAHDLLNLQYARVKGVNPKLLSLDLYIPKRDFHCDLRPLVVWVHGGAWVRGDKANNLKLNIKCVASLDTGTYDFPKVIRYTQRFYYLNAFGNDPKLWKEASLLYHVEPDKHIPPFLLVRRGPRLSKQICDEFRSKLEEAGVPVTVIDASSITHREVNLLIGRPDDTLITPKLVRFLKKCLNSGK